MTRFKSSLETCQALVTQAGFSIKADSIEDLVKGLLNTLGRSCEVCIRRRTQTRLRVAKSRARRHAS